MDALHEAELFRLLLPRSLGGAEAHPLTFVQVLEAIAQVDASPAWNLGQNAVCATAAAYLAPETARRIFGDPRAILAWGPPEGGARAVEVEGGYRVTGRWGFASGARHATWLGAYCPIVAPDGTPRRTPDGKPASRVLLFPVAETSLEDVWDVVGLRGTASDAFALADHFVPEAFALRRDDPAARREPGWLYRFRTPQLFAMGFAAIALGVARSLLEGFRALAVDKSPRGTASTLRENPATQADLAHAEAQLRAARAYLLQTVRDLCDHAQHAGELTLEHRMALRLAATYTIRQATAAGNFAYDAAGATAIFSAQPFERRFRDLHTIAQQVQGRKSHYQTVGAHLLGLDAESIFV